MGNIDAAPHAIKTLMQQNNKGKEVNQVKETIENIFFFFKLVYLPSL